MGRASDSLMASPLSYSLWLAWVGALSPASCLIGVQLVISFNSSCQWCSLGSQGSAVVKKCIASVESLSLILYGTLCDLFALP